VVSLFVSRRAGYARRMGWNPAQRVVVVLALSCFLGAIAWSAVPFRTDAPAEGKSKSCVPAVLAIFTQGDKTSQTNSWLKYGYCADAAKARVATSGVIASLAVMFAAGAFIVLRSPRRRDPVEILRA
jgi:hypothetical protein